MPNSNIYPAVDKIKNKDKETSESKKMKKNTLMQLDSNPHLLSAKNTGLSTRLSWNCD